MNAELFLQLDRAMQARPATTLGRPWVTACAAQSLDGCLSWKRDAPTRLSGPEALAMTHRLRAVHDAILVGRRTVQVDNPQLTVRLAEGPSPRRVVIDPQLRCSPEAKLFTEGPPPCLVCSNRAPESARERFAALGCELIVVPERGLGLDLALTLTELQRLGIRSIMLEGGAATLHCFFRACLVDYAIWTVSPVFLGNQNAVSVGRGGDLDTVEVVPMLSAATMFSAGQDWVLHGEVNYVPIRREGGCYAPSHRDL